MFILMDIFTVLWRKVGGKIRRIRMQQETEKSSGACSVRGESSRMIPLRTPRD